MKEFVELNAPSPCWTQVLYIHIFLIRRKEFVELNAPSPCWTQVLYIHKFLMHLEEFVELNAPSRVEPKFYTSIFF